MAKQPQRKVSAVAQVDVSWDTNGDMVMHMPMVSLYGDTVTVTDMEPREKIMLWMKLLEEIEDQICALEDESGLDRDDVTNVLWWRIESIDLDDELDE